MRKIWMILAALLLACCVTAALAEGAVDLDALMAEIDAGAEDLKGLTDGIYLMHSRMDEVFFATSDYMLFDQRNTIINYAALKEKLGGEPSVTVSDTGRAVYFDASFHEHETEAGPDGNVLVLIGWEEDTGSIPRSAVGVYEATVTVTWGSLSASFPVRADVRDYTGPALTGISGIPDAMECQVGECITLTRAPEPADWSWPGMELKLDWSPRGAGPFTHIMDYRPDDEHLLLSFNQAGVFEISVTLTAYYQDHGLQKRAFRVVKPLTIRVTGGTGAERIELGRSSIRRQLYSGMQCSVGEAMIMNYQSLKAELGGEPTAACSYTGGGVEFQAYVDHWNHYGSVVVDIMYPGSEEWEPIPDSISGEYSTTVTVTWGELTAQLPVEVSIVPYQGEELRGISGLPSELELAVGEVWHVDVKPDPVDWSYPGLYLTAGWGYMGDSDDFNLEDIIDSGYMEYPGDTAYDVAFRKPLEMDFIVLLEVMDAEWHTAMHVDRVIHITVVDKPVPTDPPVEPTDPPVEPTDPPVEPTDPPVEPTDPPVEPTDPPVEPTDPPAQPLAITEPQAVYEISPDGKSIFIDKPTITGGVAPYTIAYNCYDAQSNPVNYYYSDDARTAMSPGYNGRFDVFVVVRDSAGGQAQIDTGWQDLSGYGPLPLSVLEEVAVSEISPDGRSIFINQPTVSGGTGNYTFAYNCYDAQSQPVNYYYSGDARTAMTPGYAGRFCVFVVVSDGNESIIINTGWYDLKE